MMDNFLTVEQLRDVLEGKVALGTIYGGIKSGTIPAVRIGRRALIPSWYIKKITNQPEEPVNK